MQVGGDTSLLIKVKTFGICIMQLNIRRKSNNKFPELQADVSGRESKCYCESYVESAYYLSS